MNKYFDIQPITRDEQIEVLKNKLAKKFESLSFEPNPLINVVNDFEHQKQIYTANRISNFISTEDNSIAGFRVKCTASFWS